jgi:hypothetical protein
LYALPRNKHHIDAISDINAIIVKLGLILLWIYDDGKTFTNEFF